VHADPHPGNIFVRKNEKTGIAELVLLDHGLYETLTEEIRDNLCKFWEAIVLRDQKSMDTYSEKLGVSNSKHFAEVLLQKPLDFHKFSLSTKYTEEELEYMKKVAAQRFDIIMSVLQQMPRKMLFVVRNINTVRFVKFLSFSKIDDFFFPRRFVR
jgi:aarF domain-containing kinase